MEEDKGQKEVLSEVTENDVRTEVVQGKKNVAKPALFICTALICIMAIVIFSLWQSREESYNKSAKYAVELALTEAKLRDAENEYWDLKKAVGYSSDSYIELKAAFELSKETNNKLLVKYDELLNEYNEVVRKYNDAVALAKNLATETEKLMGDYIKLEQEYNFLKGN